MCHFDGDNRSSSMLANHNVLGHRQHELLRLTRCIDIMFLARRLASKRKSGLTSQLSTQLNGDSLICEINRGTYLAPTDDMGSVLYGVGRLIKMDDRDLVVLFCRYSAMNDDNDDV